MNTHICLVSEQLLPNVLPAVLEEVEHIILLSSPEMEEHYQLLKRFFSERGVKTTKYSINAFDFESVLITCNKLLEQFPDDKLTLNVTGGTKVAALAAWQQCWFSSRSIRIIYIDTASNRLLELGDQPTSKPLRDNILSVKEHLRCCGKVLIPDTGTPPSEEFSRRQITIQLCNEFINNLKVLSTLNSIVADYSEQLRKKTAPAYCVVSPQELGKSGERICDLLLKVGVATQGLDGTVNLNTKEDRFYAGGGWLEEYVYGCIENEKIPGIDLRMNVEIQWQGESKQSVKKQGGGGKQSTKNELDIVFSWNNRLHVISCKTSNPAGKHTQKGKAPLYELDSLAEKMGGRYVRSMLVSAHPFREAPLERAKNLGITVIAGRDVLNLSKYLREGWLKRRP